MKECTNFQYVFFDAGVAKNGKVDKDNYYYICTQDLRGYDDIVLVSYPFDYTHILFYYLHLCVSKLSKILHINFNKVLYPFYFDRSQLTDKPICFIVYGYYVTPNYLRYLKKKYKGCRIVKVHRDSYSIWRRKNQSFTDKDMISLFDYQFSFDKQDSLKYNMTHFTEIESITDIPISKDYPLYDVFFAGAAKDRYKILLDIYTHLTSCGLSCFFYLTGVPKESQITKEGIKYSSQNMSYREMLYYTVNSRAVLEVNQKSVDGYTSRFLEAVMYNKKLLTNNQIIKEDKYYNPQFIQIFSEIDEIDTSFISKDIPINYKYQGEFSPINLLKLIDNKICGISNFC